MHDSKKGITKSVAGLEEAVSSGGHEPTQDEIQLRAYEIHRERGGNDLVRNCAIGICVRVVVGLL